MRAILVTAPGDEDKLVMGEAPVSAAEGVSRTWEAARGVARAWALAAFRA